MAKPPIDIFGRALRDYHHKKYSEDIVTWTSISDTDDLPLPYLFRNFEDMPKLEQEALKLAKGNILDVGCGSGSHALWLQNKGFFVKGIDISEGAIEVAKQRGLKYAEVVPLLEENKTFDTILLLMNGTGIFQEMALTPTYLNHLKSLLKPKGQILIDSSDIKYMYEDEVETLQKNRYYGELDYYISYKGEEQALKWLYLDFELLKSQCESVGLACEKIMEGDHFDYLARITFRNSCSQ